MEWRFYLVCKERQLHNELSIDLDKELYGIRIIIQQVC